MEFIFRTTMETSGILRDKSKTMDDKLMYILNNDKQNYLLCRLKLLETASLIQPFKI